MDGSNQKIYEQYGEGVGGLNQEMYQLPKYK